MPITQQCSKCPKDLSFADDAPVDSPVSCPDGHAHVVARCPFAACPVGRIAISAGSRVGGKRFHEACQQDLVITSRNPTKLRLA